MLKQSFKLSIYFLTFTFLFSNQLSIQNVDLSNGTLEVQMQNDGPVGGFQFDLTNVVVTGAQGGSAASNGFLISTSSTTVLGFSLTGGTIPSGEGTLLEVSFDGSPEEICLSSVVLSDPTGTQIDSEVGECFNANDGNEPAEGFEVDLVNTGESHLIIIQDTISGLDDGDQVGIFDASGVLSTVDPGEPVEYGEVLVGSGVWSGSQLEISAIMSIDLSDFNGPVLNGAVDGNDVVIKVYDSSEGVILDTEPTFTSGGEFGDLFTVVTDLGLSNNPDPIFGCTDSDACNFESDATDNDGSCEYPAENFDCDGNCLVESDCNGECGGDAVIDDCGECAGSGPDYECWNGEYVCDSSDCPAETGIVEISYTSYDTIGGFQFDLNNVNVVGASGGDAENAGFLLSTSASTVLGFSLTGGTISAGEGVLVNVEVDGEGACLSNVVISDALGQSLEVSIDSCLSMTIGTQTILGCTDSSACNYNSDATNDDGSCEYPEENFDCNGECIADIDCEGVCGGSSIVDECGECGGDGSSCQEELFVSFGEVDEENGIIEILMSNSTEVGGFQLEVSGIDVDSASGGSASENGFTLSNSASTVLGFSLTGTTIPAGSGALVYLSGAFTDDTVCFEDVILSSSSGDLLEVEVGDCWTSNNVLGCTEVNACNYDPEATLNDGSCIYPEDNGWCDCDGNIEDCFGECGGDAAIDECGECDGDNVSCTGCTDSNADNYDPDAIVSCEDCCEYPNYDGLIVINEINYNPGLSFDQADADYEFIELYNSSSSSIDLSGWSLGSDNINFTFDSFEADAGAYILLARNADTYPGSISYGDNSLSNSGESITLTDSNQQLVDIVTYSDGFQGDDDPWPQAADAEGATLELISADLDNSIASSWQASFVIPGGTPGYENSSEPVDIEGCTDSSACNYDTEATLDDGSCEYPEENFDCDGNCLVESDCNGECGGDAVIDECGDCDGDGASFECWDGSFVCNSLDCPNEVIPAIVSFGTFDANSAQILYSSETPIAGFQFSVNGTDVLGAGGGAAESAGFTTSTNSTTVLGFSLTGSTIPAGSAILTNVEWDLENGVEVCLENVILSNSSGSVIDVIADSCAQLDVETCDDPGACNFGSEGACEYPELNFDCEGNCIVDTDCSGECGGDAIVDECGECNGDNSSCSEGFEVTINSTGESHLIIFQDSIEGLDVGDQIGVFDLNGVLTTTEPGQEVEYGELLSGAGTWLGDQLEISAIMSIDLSDFNGPVLNGAVDGNNVSVKVYDASENQIFNAVPTFTSGGEFGDLFTVVSQLDIDDGSEPVFGCTDLDACNYESDATDDDGSCEYPEENFDCDGNCLIEVDCNGDCGGDALEDCNGDCGGTAVEDECGVCEGDGPEPNFDCDGNCLIEVDCNGDCGGDAVEDCNGDCGGTAVEDECGVCGGDGPEENFDCDGNCLIEEDCYGECGGDAELDECGVCEGDDSSCAVYVELEITTTLDEPIEDEEELQEFASDFENYMEVELGLPQGTVEVTNIIFTETRDVEVTIEFSVTLTEEELTESDFDADTIEEEIEETVSNVEEEIEEGLPDFVEGCIDENACNYDSEATLNDGSCEYPEENFDCNGDCIVETDCNGDCGGDAVEDCAGECGGDALVDDCGVCDGDGTSCETEGCTDDSACNFNSEATVDDGSCIYEFTTYYLDTDGDGLGYGAGQEFCENPGEGWSLNGDDLYPNCSSNYVDSCGECDGDGGECSGCTDPEAFNGNCLSGNLPLTATGGCNDTVVIDDGSCIYVPGEFTFEQSTNQAYYFVIESQIDGDNLVELEDWIGAFKDGVCVGSWPWVGPYTTIPVMGYDGDELTEGYMETGDVPEFIIFDGSASDSYVAEASDSFSWVNFEFYYLDSVNVYADCNGDLGGTAFIDDCGICSEGNTGHVANSDDVGCGCFALEASEYYFDSDGDGLGFGDSTTYCSELGDLSTDNTQYELVPDGWVLESGDQCPDDAENDADQDAICGDVDDCPYDAENDADGDGICGDVDDCPYDAQNDADQDAICGDIDECPYDAENDADQDGICGDIDDCPYDVENDTDGDGLCGDVDECPYDAENDADQDDICGDIDDCPYDAENDADQDGICGDVDECPYDAENDADQDGICGDIDDCPYDAENDVDQDGICGDLDECPYDAENDADQDGICGDLDECPYDPENDADQDGICGDVDDCPYDADNDIDSDGQCGDVDPCPFDALDDSDNDGSCDSDDICPGENDFIDSDGDTIVDCLDAEPDCATNDTDECGICAGDNSTCSGCTDSEAFNFDCLTGEIPQSAINGCGHNVTVDDGSCIYTPEGFEYNQSSLQAFYFVVDADLDEESLVELDDWIGVFRGDVCVGAWPWQGPYTTIPAMGDDGEEYSEGYLLSGEIPSFKIYDSSSNSIYDANPSTDIAWANTGIYTLDYISGFSSVSYALDLHYGANLISFYALPDDLTLANVFESVEGLVTGVIGEGVAASPNPSLGWVGSLSEVQAISGYWVKMAGAGILEGSGQPVDPDTNYDLHYGANLISYPFAGTAVLGNTIPEEQWQNIDGVIGEGVAATYNPAIGWVGSLSGLEGGRGYWFKVNQPIEFTYIPPSDVSRKSFDSSLFEQLSEFEFTQSTRQGFYFIESIEGVQDGDWVLSYNNNVLVGARKWNGSYTDIPAMGYDEDLNTAGYCEVGDMVRFSLYRPSTGETFNLSADNLSPWEDNLIDIVTSLSIEYGNFAHGFELNDVYPNPFNPSTTINFTVSNDVNLSLVIYDMNGRVVDTLIDSNVSPGVYDITWNANSFASGVYFAKLSSGAFEQTQKLILIK